MLIYTNEIKALEILWKREIEHYKSVCKQKGEAMRKLNEIENEELIAEASITGLQTAIDELQKMQKELPLERLDEKSI